MKQKFYPFVKPVLFVVLLAIAFSCKKDDPDPVYVGRWVDTGTYSDGNVTLEYKDIIILNKGTFEQIQQVKNPTNNEWLNLLGLKGTFTVQDDKMSFSVTEAGQSSVSTITSLPTGQIEYLKSTDTDFADFLAYLEIPATFESQFLVNGNEITIKSDFNGDQDYNDPGETTTYTRQ